MNDLKGIIEDCNKSDLVSDKVIKKVIEIIGQEEWQDLHDENNDVCTTIGELIITLKGIAELEKENAELKKNYEDSLVACGVLKEKIDLMTKPSPIEVMQDALITTQKVAFEKQKDQLTKAKELLTRFVMASVYFNGKEADLVKEAEQFLKE